jgi:hypothetical protein
MGGVSEAKLERNFLYWHPGEHVFRGLPEPFDVEPFLRGPSEMIEKEPFKLSRRDPASPRQFTRAVTGFRASDRQSFTAFMRLFMPPEACLDRPEQPPEPPWTHSPEKILHSGC